MGCVGLDTGLATPDWRDFLESECHRHSWPLKVFRTTDSYERVVVKYGFPGPAKHGMMMNYLKGRAMREVKKSFGTNILFAGGARSKESKRRGKTATLMSRFEGITVWQPLLTWSDEEVWAHFNSRGLHRAPAYSTLGMSGDCLCGAFARPDERGIIAQEYPSVETRLLALEQQAARHGKRGIWGWGAVFGRDADNLKTLGEQLLCAECAR